MTEAQSPFTAFDQGFMQAAKFYQINNTYEIRDFANGLFFELFKILERELNFTAHILKRKDSGWGGKNSDWPNGKNLNTLFDLEHGVWKLVVDRTVMVRFGVRPNSVVRRGSVVRPNLQVRPAEPLPNQITT